MYERTLLDVFQTPLIVNGKPRELDDYQPRANVKKLVKAGILKLQDLSSIEAWFPLVQRIVRIGHSYDLPILGFLRLLRFLGQPGSHSSEESPTSRGIYL